jgi:hypothetical protein
MLALVAAVLCSPLGPGTKLLEPIRYRQLTVIPVARTEPGRKGTDYLTLAAGLESKQVAVAETGSVNMVQVRNGSGRPLLLLAGEIILGGQQDRVIAQGVIVAPRETAMVAVYCVEHGRWSGENLFRAAGGMAEAGVRAAAEFDSSQQGVWDRVALKSMKLGAAPATGTYRNLAVGEEGRRAAEPFRAHLRAALEKLPERDRLVGLVAAINGRIASVDLFADPALFARYRDALLDSYFISAADVPETADAAKAPTGEMVGGFISSAKEAPATPMSETSAGRALRRKAAKVQASELLPRDSTVPVMESYQAR